MNIPDQQAALIADLRENISALTNEVKQLRYALTCIAKLHAQDHKKLVKEIRTLKQFTR